MYCPSCANSIDVTQKFCRACGANVSLVPQAMTGRLPEAIQDEEYKLGRHRRRGKRPPSIDGAVSSIFAGIGFLAVSIAIAKYAPAGQVWWFWMLIPAFSCIGAGIGQYLKLKDAERRQQSFNLAPSPVNFQPAAPSQPRVAELSAPTTSELKTPSSVIENTTRHLERR